MNTTTLLHTDREAVRKQVLKSLKKSEKDLQKDVDCLQKWFKTQLHLPEIPSDIMIEIFLIINKFSIEKCKQKLDMYYTIRSLVPELYVNKNPKLPHMKDIARRTVCIPLPRLTKSFSRVILMKLNDVDPNNFDTYNFLAHTFNVTEIRLLEESVKSDIFLYDLAGCKLGHLMKITPIHLKKSAAVLENVYSSRVEGIHYINCPPFMIKLVNIAKTLLKEKIRGRIHVHKDLNSLYKYLPKDMLPTDYGGQEISIAELHELWIKKFEENETLFDRLESLRVNENLRAGALKNDEILGFHGNFKKLDVD